MDSCCENKSKELEQLRTRQSGVLKTVLVINLLMFGVELVAGILSQSTSLMADSLDMFGDAVVYAFSLFVLYKSLQWRASAALLKGVIMTAFGIGVLIEAGSKVFTDIVPAAHAITWTGLAALAANTFCLVLLLRHRDDDINMKSTWLCSRNDIIANLGVLAAGAGVMFTGSKWPDIVIGGLIASTFLATSFGVLKEALDEWRRLEAH